MTFFCQREASFQGRPSAWSRDFDREWRREERNVYSAFAVGLVTASQSASGSHDRAIASLHNLLFISFSREITNPFCFAFASSPYDEPRSCYRLALSSLHFALLQKQSTSCLCACARCRVLFLSRVTYSRKCASEKMVPSACTKFVSEKKYNVKILIVLKFLKNLPPTNQS